MPLKVWAVVAPVVAAAAAALAGCSGRDAATPPDAGETPPATRATTAADCAKCHPRQHETWHRTYHRTMTRDATPENVKGDFANATHHYQGLRTRLTREGDAFFMETVDPDWAERRARAGDTPDRVPPPRYAKFRVDRLVGSHWLQECLHQAPDGRFLRLPVLYHIGEKRWVHSNGAFLSPDTHDFWSQSRGAIWNESCLYCHNTGPVKNPIRGAGNGVVGYQSEVSELGISCAACHGPGTKHVGDPTHPDADVVHPARLSVPRRDEICARCHGALVPKPEAWDRVTHRDPFVPGQDLSKFNSFFRSEAEQAVLARGGKLPPTPLTPGPTDGRFWGDGTPLTTALEFNGLSLSACYQKSGKMSCLTCHTMHGDDPNMMLKPAMQTNDACYQCHADYRAKLADHTRHAAGSAGSLCYNCHMPHQVYSLMTTHRSHRIQTPDVAGSVGTGKPHACNLCHLDKSLGWTRDELAKWPGQKTFPPPKLSPEEETISAAVLTLSRGDARSRVIVAGAFRDPAARLAAGTDWTGSVLTRVLEHERYPAVRHLAHRGLQAAHGDAAAGPFDPVGTPAQRLEELRSMRSRFDAAPVRRPFAFLPLTARGLPDDAVLERLRKGRHDPDLSINE